MIALVLALVIVIVIVIAVAVFPWVIAFPFKGCFAILSYIPVSVGAVAKELLVLVLVLEA